MRLYWNSLPHAMITKKIVIKGMVQGIGYRPFVAELAEGLHITGWVRNTDGIVTVLATGEPEAIAELVRRLKTDAPAGAWVESIDEEECSVQSFERFTIAESEKIERFEICRKGRRASEESGAERDSEKRKLPAEGRTFPLLPADLPTCGRCVREMHDRGNRRYRHPFISCTLCGPRYSILEEIPYDREHISMKTFPLCPECDREYRMQGNVRRHAQTIACKGCGPRLCFTEISFREDGNIRSSHDEEAISSAIRHLRMGGTLAVKDIGGYHLAVTPFSEESVQGLRRLKGREKKPFAILFPNAGAVREYCLMNDQEEQLLDSPPRPIVLLKKKAEENAKAPAFCESVCGSSPDIGAMLPCNPVQIMLTEALGPLIMTSANGSGELMITENERMFTWMEDARKRLCQDIPDRGLPFAALQEDKEGRSSLSEEGKQRIHLAVLSHDRPILTPLDDSIVRLVCGKKQTLRRGRGMVPEPMPFPLEREVLAAGGDLKACFCYTGQGKAYLSQHLGDLMEEDCFGAYQRELFRMKELFGFCPEITVCDRHPGYRSVNYFTMREPVCGKANGQELRSGGVCTPAMQVQHHKAHVASVIAEHDLKGDVLGFAFDGTGYGDDGTVWGSEVFLWDGYRMERRAHLKPVLLIGGEEGAKNADTILYGYMASFSRKTEMILLSALEQQPRFSPERYGIVKRAVGMRLNCVQSSSMGRLFDAVSAFLDICHYNSYEGEAPVELENLAATTEEAYPLSLALQEDDRTGRLLMDTEPLFCGMAEALKSNIPVSSIARGFLYGVADAVVEICEGLAPGDSAGERFMKSESKAKAAFGNPDKKEQMTGKRKQNRIALSGGTFLNRILLEGVTSRLEALGYAVYRNEQVPPGDGGICLGQAYLAGIALEKSYPVSSGGKGGNPNVCSDSG